MAFINGFLTGLILQLAVGPVFIFVMNISVQRTVYDGLAASAAVTLADYIYIISALLGASVFISKRRIRTISGIIGSCVLIIFGFVMIVNSFNVHADSLSAGVESSMCASFLQAFILTISSPLTVFFWTGMFASKAAGLNYSSSQMRFFGIGAGAATFVFLGTASVVFSLAGSRIPAGLMKILNPAVGAVLAAYGIFRIIKMMKNYKVRE